MSDEINILYPGETELYIQSARPYEIEEIGSSGWLDWHQRMQKLSQQAVLEASGVREERVKEVLNVFRMVPVFIQEAITVSIWRQKVLPLLLKLEPEAPTHITIYIVLMHEATAVSLLEIVMFHEESCVNTGDEIVDLVDYSCEAITRLIGLVHSGYKDKSPIVYNADTTDKANTDLNELENQGNDLLFSIGIRCLTLISYVVDHLPRLPLGIGARLMRVHDVPLLMAEVINISPWAKNDNKGWHKYINGKWQTVSGDNVLKLSKTEVHVWLCLRQLILDAEMMNHYELTDFRRNRLSRLQTYLSDIVMDQVPPLIQLKHFLAQLPLTGQSTSNPVQKAMLMEVVPQIKESILKRCKNRWTSIAEAQKDVIFKTDHNEIVEMAKTLSSAYSNEVLEHFENTNITKCENCGKDAAKKCSRCKGEWYCSRQCQVERWAIHKDICDQLVNKSFT